MKPAAAVIPESEATRTCSFILVSMLGIPALIPEVVNAGQDASSESNLLMKLCSSRLDVYPRLNRVYP